MYVCPSSSKVIPKNVQYGYFQVCRAAYVAAGNRFAALRLSLLSAPSKYILAGDISSDGTFPTGPDADEDNFSTDPPVAASPNPFHNGKVNLVFADGHCGGFPGFDAHTMTTHHDLKPDGTGYSYSE